MHGRDKILTNEITNYNVIHQNTDFVNVIIKIPGSRLGQLIATGDVYNKNKGFMKYIAITLLMHSGKFFVSFVSESSISKGFGLVIKSVSFISRLLDEMQKVKRASSCGQQGKAK